MARFEMGKMLWTLRAINETDLGWGGHAAQDLLDMAASKADASA